MSQIDKIIYLPILFWFLILFSILYFIIFFFYSIIIFTTIKVRILFIKNLFNFLINIIKSNNILIIEQPLHFLKTEIIIKKLWLSLIRK